jgi:hypothetical protein
MTIYIAFVDFFRSRAGIALLASVLGGVVATVIWAEISHFLLRKSYPEFTGKDRSNLIGPIMGIVERLLLTILTLWLPQALGPIAAAVIAVKAVLGWGDLQASNTRPGRTRYSVSFMNGLVSIIWAVAWGIWGTALHAP